MKFLKRLLPIMLLLLLSLVLFSCEETGFEVDVMAVGEGDVTVAEECIRVPWGTNAAFDVPLPAGESIIQVLRNDYPMDSGYSYENGVLTIYDVRVPQTIRIVSGNPALETYWGVDPNTKYGGYISSSVKQGRVPIGTKVTLNAVPRDGAVFLGWSLRRQMKSGGEVLGTEEQQTLEITDKTFLYANFNADNVPRP